MGDRFDGMGRERVAPFFLEQRPAVEVIPCSTGRAVPARFRFGQLRARFPVDRNSPVPVGTAAMNRYSFPALSSKRRLVLVLFAMSFIAGVFAPSLVRAQAGVAVSVADPKTAADAARCLAIDNEIAALNLQLRSGAITAAVRKERADALTAERTRITRSYGAANTPANRALVAEFNRLKAAAATAARERAVAEAQAKREAAAADLKAKRDAAAADSQARRDAATAAEAEKARLAAVADDALLADVGAVADERLQRARDKFYVDFGLPDPTSAAVIAQQASAAQAIRARHTPPAAPELRPPFGQRVDELVKSRLPDRTKEWFAEVFPAPAEVMSSVSGDTEKSAALELATRRLSEHTTGTRPRAAQLKLEAYQSARGTLKPDFTQVIRLTQDKGFEARVFEKSLPAYAAQLRRGAARDQAAAAAEAQRKRINQFSNLGILCILIAGAWLPVRLMRHQKFRWKRQSEADWKALMATTPLPEELWWVEVPGFRYPVTLFSGKIYDKEIWTETTTTTTTSTTPGTNYGYGYNAGYTTTQTHVSSTTYHRYWLVTTTGEKTWHKYSDNEFIATAGQKISSIWSDNYWVLLSFNHEIGTLAFPAWWTKTMHKPPFWRIVAWTALLGTAVGAAFAITIMTVLGVNAEALSGETGDPGKALSALLIFLVPLLMIYVGIVGAIWTARRQSHFRKMIVPKYEAFLRGYDPVIPDVATKA